MNEMNELTSIENKVKQRGNAENYDYGIKKTVKTQFLKLLQAATWHMCISFLYFSTIRIWIR